jgi:Tfp pilus assembly protein PilN
MNKINFAKTNLKKRSPKKLLFKKLPLMLCITAIAVMFTLQIMQWTTMSAVCREKLRLEKQLAPFNQLVTEKKKLEEELPVLEKTVLKMERAKQIQDPFFVLFNAIHTFLGAAGSIESLAITKKKLEITISASSVKTAQEFMYKLAQLPSVSLLDLSSIHRGTTQLLFNINGKLA